MSSDNGIYILQSKDGYRVIHAQAIENLYWHPVFCCINQEITKTEDKEGFSIERCKHCENKIKWEEREELNPKMLINYFDKSKVFKTEIEALIEAKEFSDEIIEDSYWVEYGISFIRGWEDKEFPKK